jgi:hypothetical protein
VGGTKTYLLCSRAKAPKRRREKGWKHDSSGTWSKGNLVEGEAEVENKRRQTTFVGVTWREIGECRSEDFSYDSCFTNKVRDPCNIHSRR